MNKKQFIKKYKPPPVPIQRVWEFESDLDELLNEMAKRQRDYDATYPNCELIKFNPLVTKQL